MTTRTQLTGPAQEPGMSRRTLLKRGAVLTGGVVWTAPAIQALTMSVADAASGPPPGPGPTPTVPVTGSLPSHGFAIVTNGTQRYLLKIEGGQSPRLSGSGNQDKSLLTAKGITGYSDPTPAVLAAFAGSFGTTTHGGLPAYFITVPTGWSFATSGGVPQVYAYTYDGSFLPGGGACGDGDIITRAFVDGRTARFTKACNEPVSGE